MIIGTFNKCEVGKRYSDYLVSGKPEQKGVIPYIVLREATFEEWHQGLLNHDDISTEQITKAIEYAHSRPIRFFYEVSVD